jgi:predicted nucleotidyltransferase component of viral defense system
VTEAPTTEELLDDAEARTGLARGQLLMMVAKSATVRHLACHTDYRDLFVLKGGTLLSNVYRSPRQSVKDADYTSLDPQTLLAPEIEQALSIDGEYGFHLAPQEVFSFDRDMFAGDAPFSMDGIVLELRGRDRELKITVSVRAGERLDPPKDRLFYHDPLLARDQTFEVNGLTRDELSAEKILAWCSKPLAKHFVDLAYVAREHHEHIDRDKVADLVRRKFNVEGRSRRYAAVGIRRPADLVRTFADTDKLRSLREDWEQLVGSELLFLPSERAKPPAQTLTNSQNVERICLEFWQPTLDLLAST